MIKIVIAIKVIPKKAEIKKLKNEKGNIEANIKKKIELIFKNNLHQNNNRRKVKKKFTINQIKNILQMK